MREAPDNAGPGEANGQRPRATRPWVVGIAAAVVVLLVSGVSVMVVRSTAHHAIDQDVREGLTQLATTLAATIDPTEHARLTHASQEQSQRYETLSEPLRRVQARAQGVRFVYTVRLVGDGLCFVLDGSPPGDADNDGVEDHSYLMDVYEDPDPAIFEALRAGTPRVTDEPYTDRWGTFLSGYAPIVRPDGRVDAVVGVDVSAGEYRRRLASVDSAAACAMLPALLISVAVGRVASGVAARAARHAEEIGLLRLRAEHASDAKSRLIANLSHELRTPLGVIIGFSDIAFDPTLEPEVRDDAITTVRRTTEHLYALINDLLDLSKAEAGAVDIEPADVALDELVRASCASAELRCGPKGLAFEIDRFAPLPAAVRVDPVRTRQILMNLLNNAVKFTDAGRIGLQISAREGVLVFRVSDTGPGMTPEQLGLLFRPFVQLESTKKHEGAGLGLALCARLAGLMGGRVMAESEPGKGSVFTAEIPYQPASEPDNTPKHTPRDTPRAAPDEKIGSALPLGSRRILLAEDGEDNRRLITFFLARAGAQVVAVPDGRSALDAIESGSGGRIDLVLTDWHMPVLDGEGLVRELRRRGWTGPIVSITAHAMASAEQACLAAGCDAHLTKPIERDRLIGTLQSLTEPGARAAAA